MLPLDSSNNLLRSVLVISVYLDPLRWKSRCNKIRAQFLGPS